MSAPDVDRNLLLGVLALQLDFVNPASLSAAMRDWAAEKTRALGDILQSRGDLTADRKQLLDDLVREHAQAYGGDTQASLAAAARTGPERGLLWVVDDADVQADVQASLARVAPSIIDPNETVDAPTGSSLGEQGRGAENARYRVLRPHARGGLGQVFVAE